MLVGYLLGGTFIVKENGAPSDLKPGAASDL